MNRNDLYNRITDQIITQLEKGTAPWLRPWATIGGGLPQNVASSRRYRGINTLLLWSAAEEHGYDSNLWGTYRQWSLLDGHVNRGEHGTRIIWWNVTTETIFNEQTGEEREDKRFYCKEYTVFNLAQCGGDALDRFRVARPVREFIDYQPAEEAIVATGADIQHGGNVAYYNWKEDYIRLPIKEAFNNEAGYYCAALHELAHWTGHDSRLRRLDRLARFGDETYAAEELVAEMASAFLASALGIPNERTLDSSSSYLANWLSVLRSDNRAIFTASTAASAAAEYVLSFSQQVEPEVESEAAAA